MLCMHALLSHVTRIRCAPNSRLGRQLCSWCAPILHLGARQLTGLCAKCSVGVRQVQFWRAPSPVLARQVASWCAPSAVLAPEFNSLGFIGNVVVWLGFVLSWLLEWCRCVHCFMLVQCVVAHLQVPIHYAILQLEVDPRPVPVPARAGEVEGQPQEQWQEQRQEQQEGLGVDVDVVVDLEVPEVPAPADFGDALHSLDKFLKVTSAEATAVDVVDRGGGAIISRLFQGQVIRRGSGHNRVVECPFRAVVQGKGGVQPWVVFVVPFVQVRPPLHAQPAPPLQH